MIWDNAPNKINWMKAATITTTAPGRVASYIKCAKVTNVSWAIAHTSNTPTNLLPGCKQINKLCLRAWVCVCMSECVVKKSRFALLSVCQFTGCDPSKKIEMKKINMIDGICIPFGRSDRFVFSLSFIQPHWTLSSQRDKQIKKNENLEKKVQWQNMAARLISTLFCMFYYYWHGHLQPSNVNESRRLENARYKYGVYALGNEQWTFRSSFNSTYDINGCNKMPKALLFSLSFSL